MWNDARLQSFYYQTMLDNESCKEAIKTNERLSEKIFSYGEVLERYERINRFSKGVVDQKKIYALLQIQLWVNSIYLREKCGADYSTIIYFYSHFAKGTKEKDQAIQSYVLVDALHECEGKLVAFPIPVDVDVDSIRMIKDMYGINDSITLLVNESIVLTGVQDRETIRKYVGC